MITDKSQASSISIFNIYIPPNTTDKTHYKSLLSKHLSTLDHPYVIGSDCNKLADWQLDHWSNKLGSPTNHSLATFIKKINTIDTFRFFHKYTQKFTHFSIMSKKRHASSSACTPHKKHSQVPVRNEPIQPNKQTKLTVTRIDYILLHKSLSHKLLAADIIENSSITTDH